MRPLITSLLILVILLAGGYLFVERILIHALDNQLTAAGIELQRIDDLDVSNTGVSIGAISLASAEWRVSGDQLTILLGREGELFVSARSLQFDLTPNQAGPVESEPLTIEALLQSVEDSMADMPHRGLVEQMRYCQPGVCVDFTLQWRRYIS